MKNKNFNIQIDEFNGGQIIDVYLLNKKRNKDDNSNKNEIKTYKQGLNFDIANSYILHLKEIYNLSDSTQIKDNVFNDNEELKNSYSMSLGEFINL